VIDADQRNSCLEQATLRTLILLLYGAGLRLREAIDLTHADVDFRSAVMTIRNTKFGKARLVPFGSQLAQALTRYAARARVRQPQALFFATRMGMPVKPGTLERNFRILCDRARIRRTDGATEQPRLHDLRHTFAVHRLISWYRQGADVQRLLHQLSVYLGHVHTRAGQEAGESPHDPAHDGDTSAAGWSRHQYDPCLVGPCLPQYNEHLRRSGSGNEDESPGELRNPGGRTQAALASRPGADGIPAFVVGRSVIGHALGSFRSCDKQLARRHNPPETASACRTACRTLPERVCQAEAVPFGIGVQRLRLA